MVSSTSTPADSSHGGTEESKDWSCPFIRKTVCLYDWWLVKTESVFQGKRLGIAGLTSREKKQAWRVFSSAAISKRLDVFTLETSDGVIIHIQGFINKQRTADSGFPSEVFKDFVFGFPPNWEKYAEKHCTGEDSITAVSGLENSPSTARSSSEETPKKNRHVIHKDRKEVEISEDQSHKVSENIAIHSSKISNFNSQHGHEKGDEMNVTPMGYKRRCSERLRNLRGNQENSASCSLRNETNVSPTSGVTTVTRDVEKLNCSIGGAIPSVRKLNMSGKSPFHLSAKISRSKMKEKRVIVCGLQSQKNKLNPLPVVSDHENKLVQNELGGGSIPISSGNKLQEPVDTNMVEILGGGSVKDGPQQSSKSKGRKSKNVNTKAAKETDAKEEESTPKNTRRKIIYDKQVSPPSPEEKAKTFVVSPECSAYRRSRSGRLLLPPMEFWRNQMPIYDLDRNITGIQGDLPVLALGRGSRSEPPKKRKRQRYDEPRRAEQIREKEKF